MAASAVSSSAPSGSSAAPRRWEPAPRPGGFDIGSLVGQVAGGGVGGAILMIIVGLIKQAVVR